MLDTSFWAITLREGTFYLYTVGTLPFELDPTGKARFMMPVAVIAYLFPKDWEHIRLGFKILRKTSKRTNYVCPNGHVNYRPRSTHEVCSECGATQEIPEQDLKLWKEFEAMLYA